MERMKFVFAFALLLLPFGHLSAKGDIFIGGAYVYAENNGKQETVPFASISFYHYPDTTQLAYFTMSGLHGDYRIRPYDNTEPYHVVVDAIGYKEKTFLLEAITDLRNEKGEKVTGNASVHIRMEKEKGETASSIVPETYQPEVLSQGKKIKELSALLSLVPGLKHDGNNWVTDSGGSVRFFVNGMDMPQEIAEHIGELPSKIIKRIEYYRLPTNAVYAAVLNIVLTSGGGSKAPTYTLKGK
ncbi:MAG: hypothetical protein LBL81_07045 [Tannerella sp.]|nr:hypothetical protein [Tannerella sp.]